MKTSDIEEMKEKILAEYERLTPDDEFSFRCHNKLNCFNTCCGDVNIALTPYDVIRLKQHLGLTSSQFIQRYTVRPFTKEQRLPVVLLRMDESKENKPCQFVTEQGCSVYDNRPWPCRMYPVGTASARTDDDPNAPEFFFLMKDDPCDGFGEDRKLSIGQWMEDQGVGPYDKMGELFKQINLHPFFRNEGSLNPQQMEMYFTACYDLDKFRGFVFESSFLDKYEVEPETVEKIRDDDVELFRFAVRWLRTCLFSEKLVPLKDEVAKQYKEKLAAQGKKVK